MFHPFWLLFRLPFGPDFDPKLKKVPLQSAFEKTTEKYTLPAAKSRLSKSKNIAKTLDCCSKSYFSHLRNDVEKMTLRLSFRRSF